ncbi:MAG: helix-turn-helix transcriptional regulator [Bacteroidetes bacterium]|nr:helix-turn-helix transcriptional regulator [Bacteroidota bacterium]
MLKEARKEANMTQEELADKVGTKKSYISRLENGKCDIQLSTLEFEFLATKHELINYCFTIMFPPIIATISTVVFASINPLSLLAVYT